MDDLGALASRHPVRNQRRWVIATQGAMLGLVSTALLVVLILHPVWSNAGGRLAGLLLVGVTVGFLVVAVQATEAVRGGPSESFEIHEHGIAHTTKSGRRAWTWQQITRIHRLSHPGRFPRNGWDFRCTVRFDDGSTIQFNGLTVDAHVVAAALLDHRPDALDTREVLPGWQFWRWVLPFVAAGCAWIVVTIFRMFDDYAMVEVSPGYYREVPRFDDSELALFAITALVCVVGLALSLSYLAVGLRAQLRRR
ncbi:hypothetical protein ABGB07_00230 [Micromonosporaceae bacterium B7E4]